MSYYRKVYLKSEHWQNLRLSRLVKSKSLCACCHYESISNDVHHITYGRSLYEVKPDDVRVLCRTCHAALHSLLDEYPALKHLPFRIRWSECLRIVSRARVDAIHAAQFGRSDWFPLFCAAAARGFPGEWSALLSLLRKEVKNAQKQARLYNDIYAEWEAMNAGSLPDLSDFYETLLSAA